MYAVDISKNQLCTPNDRFTETDFEIFNDENIVDMELDILYFDFQILIWNDNKMRIIKLVLFFIRK